MNKIGKNILFLICSTLLLVACQSNRAYQPSSGHIGQKQPLPTTGIPPVVRHAPYLPQPKKIQKPQPKYTVVVSNAPLQDVLFALARDAKLNLDVLHDIKGNITINAIDQTLEQILARIGKRVDIRYQINNGTLEISKDTPYLKTYKIPYLNIARSAVGAVSMSVRVGATGTGLDSAATSVSNDSTARIENVTNNRFWSELAANLNLLLGKDSAVTTSDQTAAADQNTSANNNVIINQSAGLVSIRASDVKQQQISAYLKEVISSAQRQILIEATIVEVRLTNQYSQGIDWRRIVNKGNGFSFEQNLTSDSLNASRQNFNISYLDKNSKRTLSSTLKLLEQFGNVKVLSSPKIMALNNQPSILKVVDNKVYFSLDFETTVSSANAAPTTNVRSSINTVPVGFVMVLTPFVDEFDQVMLNVRPTISRIIGFVNDPNPILARNNVVNKVPEVQVREMETVLKLNSGQVAILGGLMQDTAREHKQRLPGVGSIPLAKELFTGKESAFEKSELVIFVRPIHVKNPSIDADLQQFRTFLPSAEFMQQHLATEP